MAAPGLTREQRARLFWDAPPTGRFPAWEIGRILAYGTLAEVRACIRHYGRSEVERALATNRSLAPRVRALWTRYGLPRAVEAPEVHRDVLPPRAAVLLPQLTPLAAAGSFMLCGGTAVALRLGHRRSEDLDLLTPEPFDVPALSADLHALASEVAIEQQARNTWRGIVGGVRVSFTRQAGLRLSTDGDVDGVPLADTETLTALKLNAVAGRGERMDFIDVFALCRAAGWTVGDLLRTARERTPTSNDAHLLRSLTCFDDAEATPLPEMLWPIHWPEVRRFFEDGVREVLRR